MTERELLGAILSEMRVHTKQLERIEKELREIVRMLALLFGGGVAVFVYALVRGWAGN